MKGLYFLNSLVKSLFFVYIIVILSIMIFTINTENIKTPDFIFGIGIDKIVHFIVFLPYPFLFWLTFNKRFSRHGKFFLYVFIPFTGLLFAIITELLQSLNPSRDFDIFDILANILSVIFASLVLNVIHFINDRSR